VAFLFLHSKIMRKGRIKMFRKFAAFSIVAALSMSTGSAFAAFADKELIRVVYERGTGTTEQLTDLGLVGSFLSGTHSASTGTISATNANNLFVSYFAVDRTTAEMWVSGGKNAPVASDQFGSPQVANRFDSVYSYYNALIADANGIKTGQQSDKNSFMSQLNTTQGTLANSITGNSEASLASLTNGTATEVTQALYYVDSAGGAIAKALITTSNTTPNAITPTPIAPSFLLMGSGLFGLWGYRKRG
jgi:hypothetical protein